MGNEKFALFLPRSRIVFDVTGDQKRGNREDCKIFQRLSTSKLISLRDSLPKSSANWSKILFDREFNVHFYLRSYFSFLCTVFKLKISSVMSLARLAKTSSTILNVMCASIDASHKHFHKFGFILWFLFITIKKESANWHDSFHMLLNVFCFLQNKLSPWH